MRSVTLLHPRRLSFGWGCFAECLEYLGSLSSPKVHVVTSPSQVQVAEALRDALQPGGASVSVDASISCEPTMAMFRAALETARAADPNCVVGIGGGSPLDLAKLIAAFVRGSQTVEETFGIGLLSGRDCHLVCVPTTSGTGSEVSPNAILLDEEARLKKGVISPWLVPDATFIDPQLTVSMPGEVTASTGLDALTHCVEAYTNKFAHPLVDTYALRGIALCSEHLVTAVNDGMNREAREGMSLASLYGGLCLGPVNTAAVHALAYPLGGEFHVAHGLSNAILLPSVFEFNAVAAPERHADVAMALGVQKQSTAAETASAGAAALRRLVAQSGVKTDLASQGVDTSLVSHLAQAAMTVTRLLKNNPRELTQADAEDIYRRCFA